ncbi:MAG: N-acetylmuramoyl-L-alanine amidase [Abditibacteriota bacterium]|nr:N-acetylmuramoyl-L-alanine amidase [Abditibacteriota bacterium]
MKITIITVLILLAGCLYAAESADLYVAGKYTGLKAKKEAGEYFVPVTLFDYLRLETSLEGSTLTMGESVAETTEIDGSLVVTAAFAEKALGAKAVHSRGRLEFVNTVTGIMVTDDLLEIDLAFLSPYSLRATGSKLTVVIDNALPDDAECVYDTEKNIISRMSKSQKGSRLTIDCDLSFGPAAPFTSRGNDRTIRVSLTDFDQKVVRKVRSVKLTDNKDGSSELTLKGGALTGPSVTCDVYTGIYTLTLESGLLPEKPIRSAGTLSAGVTGPEVITVESRYIREPYFVEKGNDLKLVFAPPVIKPLEEAVITIDPGHGGPETGATYGGTLEKDLNLLNALKAAEELRKLGVTVYMTRTDDTDMSLADRGKYAVDRSSDLFISFHINSCGTPNTGTGVETYYHKDFTLSKYFGTLFHGFLAQNNELTDRKVRSDTRMYQSGFGVLRAANAGGVPGILLEAAFINNDYDRTFLFSEDYRNKIASDVVKAVRLYMQKEPIGKE